MNHPVVCTCPVQPKSDLHQGNCPGSVPGHRPHPFEQSLMAHLPPKPWHTRRIIVARTPCPHCGSRSFMVDPEIGVTCTQCAKSPFNPPKKETFLT